MENIHRHRLLLSFLAAIAILTTTTLSDSPAVTGPNKYQIECTMCSACDNPCGQQASSPPPPQQTTPSYNYPPPPRQQPYTYPPPLPYGGYYPPAPPKFSGYYPVPPPPNPIVPYFPFFYHIPPPALPSMSSSHQMMSSFTVASIVVAAGHLIFLFCLL